MNTDLISRSALLEQMLNHYEVRNPKQKATIGEYCMMVIHAPAVDAVEVVRCKDCEHFYDSNINPNHRCKRGGSQVWDVEFTENDFCSYGKRRTSHETMER